MAGTACFPALVCQLLESLRNGTGEICLRRTETRRRIPAGATTCELSKLVPQWATVLSLHLLRRARCMAAIASARADAEAARAETGGGGEVVEEEEEEDDEVDLS